MTKKVTVELIDDISSQSGATTTRFGLDRVEYEIDLVDDRALRDALAPYISKSRATNGRSKTPQRPDKHLVRRWAREHGYTVPERGRLSKALLLAYDEHHADNRTVDQGGA